MNASIKNSTVLVTGGAGFIGSSIIRSLLRENNKVICLDNFSTGKHGNLSSFVSSSNFNLIEGDICDLSICQKASQGVDYTLHQAAATSVPESIENPVLYNQVNITGFVNMLVASRDARVKKFVYASSCAVYGDSENPLKAETDTGAALSPYALTKQANELYADHFFNLYSLDTVGLRYFNVYGPGQSLDSNYAAVIPIFISKLIDKKSPTINGDGSYSRDFVHIDDVVQVNHLAALSSKHGASGKVYNVGSGQSTSLKKLFRILRDQLMKYDPGISKVEPVHGPLREGDIAHSQANLDRAHAELGYTPKYDLGKGAADLAHCYQSHAKNSFELVK